MVSRGHVSNWLYSDNYFYNNYKIARSSGGKCEEKMTLNFHVDTCQLLEEMLVCGGKNGIAILKFPVNILRSLLGQAAQRAIEIDDPELNAIMIALGLYNVEPSEICNQIEKQKKRIKQKMKQ